MRHARRDPRRVDLSLPLRATAVEISLFERTQAERGALAPGPPFPQTPLDLDALSCDAGFQALSAARGLSSTRVVPLSP
jgi:hypothetical protein